MDQPTIDGFNTFCICSFARDQGIKVVLSGLGADESSAGIPRFARLPRDAALEQAIGCLGELVRAGRRHHRAESQGAALEETRPFSTERGIL